MTDENNLPKLVSEYDLVSLIKPNLTPEEISMIHIDAFFSKVRKKLSERICSLKLDTDHFYSFRFNVLCQERK